MKKHISVFMLTARGAVYKAAVLLALMAAAQAALFWLFLKGGITDGGFSLEQVVRDSRMSWTFSLCFLLLTALLVRSCREVGGSYTVRRLALPGGWVFFWQCVCNVLYYILFWMAAILIAVGLCRLYTNQAAPEYVTGQTIFLAFHRSDYLHVLLPLENIRLWVENIVMLISAGICAACRPAARLRGLWSQLIPAVAVAFLFISRELGGDFGSTFAIAIPVLFAAGAVSAGRRDPDEA